MHIREIDWRIEPLHDIIVGIDGASLQFEDAWMQKLPIADRQVNAQLLDVIWNNQDFGSRCQ